MAKRRRIYLVAIPIIAMAALCFLLLRHSIVPEPNSAALPPSTPIPDFDVTPTPAPERIPEDQTQATTIKLPPGFALEEPGSGQQQGTAEPRPKKYYSLPSGMRIHPDIGTGGHGTFTAKNGKDQDAVVRLIDVVTDQTLRWFFVQAGSSAEVGQIPQGNYRVSFTTGLNWIESEDRFSWHPSYFEFEKTFVYTEEQLSVEYDNYIVTKHRVTQHSVTLNRVPFGNVRTKRITREEFLRGHHRLNLQK